ncbi:MAG: 3-deoxy-manno-octulosonate cytidylyltransferase [Myxococcales bacterium]|nr:3-deoxy-manno-octulosonate cytidylyltransferase [Myxococcales bacterium]
MSSKQDFFAVIPARYDSVRLPGKPLADIGGRPMIAWVYERACQSGAAECLVATDDERIAQACEQMGAPVEMTNPGHSTGTDRIAEVAERRGWNDEQIVVNVQGDEPLIPPALIAQVASLAARDSGAAIATLMVLINSTEDRENPNFAKVVVDKAGRALYFSRAPIPWPREGGLPTSYRHIGLYAYRVRALREIAATEPCELEQTERLEQLRALWLGLGIAVEEAVEPPPPGVDTERDLAEVRQHLARLQ